MGPGDALLVLGRASWAETMAGPREGGAEGARGGVGAAARAVAGPRLHSHGRDGTQVAVAEMEVTLGCFACHVPSWLLTKACRQLVSFSRTTHGRGTQKEEMVWVKC